VKTKYPYNILVVDDERINLESLQRSFHGDYRIFATTSPLEALEIFKTNDIHLIIADQRMPEMTGVELLEKIKEISPYPIRIVLSAYTDIDYLINAINRGEVYRYITKPWEPHDLKIAVRNALEYYQAMMDRLALTAKLAEKNKQLDSRNKSLQDVLRKLKAAQGKLVEMERLSIIGKMAGMIIHDLKQPLDIIRSAAETMAHMELETDERLELASMIKSEVERFLEMIQELLDFSKGSVTLNPELILLSDFWHLVQTRFRNFLTNSDIEVWFYLDDGEAYIRIDRYYFQRALLNLLRNSLEALKVSEGGVKPTIELRAKVTDRKVIFEVEDNGAGIPADIQENLFTPFVSSKKNFGIGLGLTIVKHIVDQHQGEISFSTTRGGGSIFTISLIRAFPA